jgi:2'-hydroxyisoflavone reductase
MQTTRRTFIAGAAALGAAASLSPLARALPGSSPASKGLRILILGGTGFIGPKTVEAAIARGHSVTVFNRGRTEKRIPFGFEGVEHLYGNRDPKLRADDADPESPLGLTQLEGKKWDVVIDNSGYYPRMVSASAELLAPHAKQYIFISSISAYADNSKPGADETSAVARLEDPAVETMGPGGAFYGGLKALCEEAAEKAFAGRATIVRPGYIVGPGDPTDRFSYWPVRSQRGGELLAPGSPGDPVQFIDARDLGAWLVKLAEDGTYGRFNACGNSAKWGDVLDVCTQAAKAAKVDITQTWVPASWLNEHGQDLGLPIWIAPEGEYAGFHTWSNARAVKSGLTFSSTERVVKGILEWWPEEIERRKRVTKQMIDDAAAANKPAPQLPDPESLKAGPTAEREAAALKAWHESQKP